MKTKLLTFLIVCPLFLLFAQSKSDTTQFLNHLGEQSYKITDYYKAGNVEKITYTSKLGNFYSKEELFMRGMKIIDVNNKSNLVDSVFLYFENGKLNQKIIYSQGHITTFDQRYNDNWTLQKMVKYGKYSSSSQVRLFENNQLEISNGKIIIEGRIGETIHYNIPAKLLKKEEIIKVRVAKLENYIEPIETINWKEGLEGTIELNVKIPAIITLTEIILENSKGEIANLPIEIIGYDLFDLDFKEDRQSKLIDVNGRRKVVIKSEGNNKLVRLYYGKELIDNYPISQRRSTINIKGFKKGTYLLESINLGNNEKRYCQLNLH